ncbi:MAG: trypsin-like peptidase domain-containing protein [Betaproteobacteria bacterium]|nr:trypsin-like peptidase domain-containing protein [Betaproteobacteria bacterium]MDE2047818.1 trypsin-like peptidase domain-containing protein [Betaproteobacteria bacterium]
MRKLWLLFSQAVTVLLAALFVVSTLKPQWLAGVGLSTRTGSSIVSIREAVLGGPTAQASYAPAAKRAMPAVVSIATTKALPRNPHANEPWFKYFFGDQAAQPELQRGLGSGVIVSPQGYILTNNHVVEGVDEIELMLSDGRRTTAKVVGTDPDTDLAVLKIDLKDLPAITFGSLEKTQVGDVVLAIGNPFDVGQTVTMGIVSALGRNDLGINTFENFIQTDAAINPGNSGGALIDSNGNLLGINSAIYSRSGGSLGIGFAIPVTTAKQVMEQIITNGQVIRGWIGVEPQALTPELAESFGLPKDLTQGVVIAGVLQGGPADKAGLRPGDVVVAINGTKLRGTPDLLNTVAALAPDSKAQLTVLRGARQSQVDVVVGRRPKARTPRE